MVYWRYPVKAKSAKTVEKNNVLKVYKKTTSQNQLEKLSEKQLKNQKDLFKQEIEKLNSKYSIEIIDEKLEELNTHTNKIKELANNVKELCEKYKNQIYMNKSCSALINELKLPLC